VRLRIWSVPNLKKRPIALDLRDRISPAFILHEGLNHAISQQDKVWLERHCCQGLYNAATSRITRNMLQHRIIYEPWALVRYRGREFVNRMAAGAWPLSTLVPTPIKGFKLLNDTVGQVPGASDVLLRQVIVRIWSVQNFSLNGQEGMRSRHCMENVVIQKVYWQGQEGEWKIWGTVKESSLQDIKKMIRQKSKEGGMMDRIRGLMGSGGMGGQSSVM
jgi:mitochondrial protein MBA1